MRQAIHALETDTWEVHNYLLNEINSIYGYKVGRNVFRSLANLIAHKRSFCKQQYRLVRPMKEDPDTPVWSYPRTPASSRAFSPAQL